MINVTEDVIIRKMSLNDLHQVFNLGIDSYGNEQATPFESIEDLAELEFGESGFYFGVIEYISGFNAEFVGYICVFEESAIELSIADIAIKKEFQNKKIAQQCIAAFLDYIFKVKSYQRVQLQVRPSNFSAIKCYENLNFKKIESIHEYYLDKEDAIKMEYVRVIDSPSEAALSPV